MQHRPSVPAPPTGIRRSCGKSGSCSPTHWTAQVVGVDVVTPLQHTGKRDVVEVDVAVPLQYSGILDDGMVKVQETCTSRFPGNMCSNRFSADGETENKESLKAKTNISMQYLQI
jgi:hypothetical protein